MTFDEFLRYVAEDTVNNGSGSWSKPSLEPDPEECPGCGRPRPVENFCASCAGER